MKCLAIVCFLSKIRKSTWEKSSPRISELQSRVENVKISLGLQQIEGDALGILLLYGVIRRHSSFFFFFLSFCRLPLIPGNRTLIFLTIKKKTPEPKPQNLIFLRHMGGMNTLNNVITSLNSSICVDTSVNLEWISF